eukprot:4431264-Lingulodinium_polyedra.AAC.1
MGRPSCEDSWAVFDHADRGRRGSPGFHRGCRQLTPTAPSSPTAQLTRHFATPSLVAMAPLSGNCA